MPGRNGRHLRGTSSERRADSWSRKEPAQPPREMTAANLLLAGIVIVFCYVVGRTLLFGMRMLGIQLLE